MEEQEVPLDDVHEHIAHEAESSREKWISRVALSTAVLAAFAAISALLAGDHANDAMIEQIAAADQWNLYQAKGIKAEVLGLRLALSPSTSGRDQAKLADYARQQAEIRKQAEELQATAREHLARHVVLARGVTLFQIAIAIAAIAILTRRRVFWSVSLLAGAFGLGFLVWGLFFVARI